MLADDRGWGYRKIICNFFEKWWTITTYFTTRQINDVLNIMLQLLSTRTYYQN